MVFIYGGGYASGAAKDYGPDFLINQNVIVVSTILYLSNMTQFKKFEINRNLPSHFCFHFVGNHKLSSRTIWIFVNVHT